jgi:hypothetical protein
MKRTNSMKKTKRTRKRRKSSFRGRHPSGGSFLSLRMKMTSKETRAVKKRR